MKKNMYLHPLRSAIFRAFSLISLSALCLGAFAQNPVIGTVNYNDWVKVVQPPISGNYWAHFPRASAFDVQNSSGDIIKKVIFNWSTAKDSVFYPTPHGWAGSVNEAVTLNSPSPTNTTGSGALDLTNIVKRNTDGVMIAIPAYFGNTGGNANDTLKFDYRTSTDNGTTWSVNQTNGRITGFGGTNICASFHFHRGIIQDADGTLYAPAYAQFNPGSGYESHRVILVKSTDGGINWKMVSTVQYTAGISYTESAIARCKDGSILVIMRNSSSTATNPLKYRRSTDNGVNWSTVTYVPSIPTNAGVDPFLEMMPNGVLVLSYGDNVSSWNRDNKIAYDPNGTGASWVFGSTTFNSATDGESTAYTSVFPLRNNQFMQLSDRGTYRYYGTDETPAGNPLSLWTKKIDVVFNNEYKNRIDLKSMYHDGKITVSGMSYTTTAHPECRQSGAFDASTDYWSGAFANSNSDTYTIDLQKIHRLCGISICLQKGVQQSATISCSKDNVNWTTLKTYTNVTHFTVDYTKFSPTLARYVKVAVNGTAGKVAITELNLFSTNDTFEDFALNTVPYGYTAPSNGFWVSEGQTPAPTGSHSKRALYMYDDNGDNKTISKTSYSAGAKKTLEFKLKIKAFAATSGSIQFMLMSGTTTVYQFAVFPNGQIKYYNGTWNNVGSGPISFALDTFKTIKVVADLTANKDSVFVNNVLIGTNATKQGTATTMNGFKFGSGGSAPTGDKALFDDVDFYDNGTGSPDAIAAAELPATTIAPLMEEKKADGAMTVTISPNPTSDIAKLNVKNCVLGKLTVYITNSFGKTIKTINGTATGTEFETTLPVQDLRLGVYIVTVEQNGTVVQTKLINNKP